MAVEARMSVLEPDSLAIMAEKLSTQFEQDMRRHFFCNYGNLFQFEIAVCFRTRRQERGSGLGNFCFRERGVQQQVATILQIAEVHSQWPAIGYSCTDGLFLVGSVGKPHLSGSSQPH